MIATQIYSDDGGYLSDGSESFIELPTSSSIQVMFIAYCADFEKDNPQYSDTFSLIDLPPELASVARKISDYEAAHPGQDTMVASQVALWLVQGVSATEIKDKFSFDENELKAARTILGAN
ncbi:hypothetical protein BA177_15085 [Woeseia oceani]|uniref:Uncharacterized protein n=2 Tax=Woeseia oceani TaxID=1548547 RepID=A0A193LIR4_9GAMM|nr:hypothetical protein BA177_15085 [Woeseia oceani]